MELWERLSRDARQAIIRAHEVAQEMKSPQIAPEHLALGIIDLGRGSGYEMLRGMGVNLDHLRDALVRAAPMGESQAADEIAFTQETQRCLRTAYLEWQKHAAVGAGRSAATALADFGGGEPAADSNLESVHLLLGLLAPSSRCECRTLISHGVFYGEVSELLRRAQ